jgi:tRNA G46 methylase TrmB
LHFKTDSSKFFEYSRESLLVNSWKITEETLDLHASDLPEHYKIMTTYEQRFNAEGLRIKYLTAVVKSTKVD